MERRVETQVAFAADVAECSWVSEYLPLRGLARAGSHCSTRSNSPSQSSGSLSRTSASSLCASDGGLSSRCSASSLEDGLREASPLASAHRRAVCRDEESQRGGPFLTAVFTLSSSAMGAGCLSLPFMLRGCGIVSGFMMLLLGAGLAHLSLTVLMEGAVKAGCSRMAELVDPSNGRGAKFVDLVLAIYGVSAVLCYLIFVGDFFSGVARSPFLGLDVSRETIIAVIAGLVVWPLSLGRGASALRHVSALSVAAICLTAVIVACKVPAYSAIRAAGASEDAVLKWWSFDPCTMLQSFSIAIFAFAAHTNAVPVAHNLLRSGGSSTQIARFSLCSVLIELAVYSLVGLGGYLSFGGATKQDFILNYPDDDPVIFVVRCISGAAVCLGAPINLNPAASSIIGLVSSNCKQASRSLHLLVVTLAIVGCAFVAIYCEGVADVISLLGGSFGSFIVLAWPASVYRRVLSRLHAERTSKLTFRTLVGAAALGFAAFACQLLGATGA